MGGGGGGQHCSVLVARRQRGELATEGNEGDEREKATERDESNGTRGESERERESKEKRDVLGRGAWVGKRETGERVEGRKGWLEESEDGSQALAQPVMIDWLAGSQQTDVRPPDRPTHPSRLVLHPRAPSLQTPSASTAVASSPELPRSKKLAIQCTTATPLPRPSLTPPASATPSRQTSSFLLSRIEHSGYPLLSLPFQPFFHRYVGAVLRALVCGIRTKAGR